MSSLPLAILAGGLATRLRPITHTIPKALVPVLGVPFLTHQLKLLARYDLRDIVLCVGYLGEQIESAYGDGHAHGVRLRYSYDGPNLRGTAGALRQALPLLGDAFLVLYGDSYLEIDYPAIVKKFVGGIRRPALMTVYGKIPRGTPSNVWFAKTSILAYNKKRPRPEMRHIDYGLFRLSRRMSSPTTTEAIFPIFRPHWRSDTKWRALQSPNPSMKSVHHPV